jgi:S1-C subfamily serine protease
MQDFGVQSPRLKAIARQPEFPTAHSVTSAAFSETRSRQVVSWAGAKARNIVGLDEVSAAGTPGETGVILLDVPEASVAGRAGFLPGDVILAINGRQVKDVQDLQQASPQPSPEASESVRIIRFQQESTIKIELK